MCMGSIQEINHESRNSKKFEKEQPLAASQQP